MTIEEAIKMAIDYETKIRDIYVEAAATVDDQVGKKIFKSLGDDEQHHIDYLQHKLKQWENTGKIVPEKLESVIPSHKTLARNVARVKSHLPKDFRGLKQQMLSRALKVEIETSNFYTRMVDEMPSEGQQMFARFLEIENNHIDAIQFELDYISKTGYWFDFKEFDME